MTAAALDHHVLVLLQNDVGALVEVEDEDRGELLRGAARFRDVVRVHQVHERLHDGVVGRVHVRVQREGALAGAVEGLVVVGGDDPVLDEKDFDEKSKKLRL